MIILGFTFTQEFITEFLVIDGDSLDNFVYQLPESLDEPAPLLVVFHQWGGSAISTTSTDFDEQAYSRGWYFLSPWGGSSNNYNHQQAQYFWEEEILWMMERFNIDSNRIYMVGGSMGGASGAIYANNHLDPTKPMVAATASASGILDCERRYYEMDGNNSMTEWFGGSPEEVPFEYHRNSAVFFEDYEQSMHHNLQYTPLYLDFGATEPHRGHGEDLYNLLGAYNANIWIDMDPSNGHGFSVIDEQHACDWMAQFELVTDPNIVRVNLDEPSRAYWLEALNTRNDRDFISAYVQKEIADLDEFGYENYLIVNFDYYENCDSLLLHIFDDRVDRLHIYCNNELANNIIGLTGLKLDFIESFDVITAGITQQFQLVEDIIWLNPNNLICGEFNTFYEFNYSINDVNYDFIWDVADILLTLEFILGNENLTSLQQNFADLNNDNFINVIDILYMVELILE